MKPARQFSSLANSWKVTFIIVITFAIVLVNQPARSQSNDYRGYLSTGVGIAFKLNGNAHPHGTQFNALEAGYEFLYGFGAVGSWTLGNLNYNSGSTKVNSAYRLFTVGPMYTLHLNRRASVDLKARLGYFHVEESAYFSDGFVYSYYMISRANLGFFATASYQYRLADRWTAFGNFDFTTQAGNAQLSPAVTTLGITVGVGFRF